MAQDSFRRYAMTFNRPVTVRVPVDVAFDLEKAQAVQREVLGRLGCQGCTSGFDIRFVHETEFIVDANLRVSPVGSAGGF